MRVLITGGNGYIAKSLATALELERDYSVSVITRKDFDLTNQKQTAEFFKHNYFDVVIHTAIVGGSRLKVDDATVVDQNLMMYYNLVANEKSFGKLISFGSGAELVAKETPYGLGKHIIRESIKLKPNYYNLRIFGVFDQNELDTRFIKSSITKYINRIPIVIHQDKVMDFIYMGDLVELVKLYVERDDLPKEVNCNYLETYKLSDIADIINNLSNYKVNITVEQSQLGSGYMGSWSSLVVERWTGLKKGIEKVYKALKNE
jgi:nucleoside-diphosphate-sugar epimerase